ncbi:hypothetical protein BKA70DRAFT_1231377 [Coprinopsis sp. MPI-PUGE-AT-0042]|nr:hypothetical protein BKA70DRAFT_1231377 [Coprinopsis sp. MPI-PUGE-AT-0042]
MPEDWACRLYEKRLLTSGPSIGVEQGAVYKMDWLFDRDHHLPGSFQTDSMQWSDSWRPPSLLITLQDPRQIIYISHLTRLQKPPRFLAHTPPIVSTVKARLSSSLRLGFGPGPWLYRRPTLQEDLCHRCSIVNLTKPIWFAKSFYGATAYYGPLEVWKEGYIGGEGLLAWYEHVESWRSEGERYSDAIRTHRSRFVSIGSHFPPPSALRVLVGEVQGCASDIWMTAARIPTRTILQVSWRMLFVCMRGSYVIFAPKASRIHQSFRAIGAKLRPPSTSTFSRISKWPGCARGWSAVSHDGLMNDQELRPLSTPRSPRPESRKMGRVSSNLTQEVPDLAQALLNTELVVAMTARIMPRRVGGEGGEIWSLETFKGKDSAGKLWHNGTDIPRPIVAWMRCTLSIDATIPGEQGRQGMGRVWSIFGRPGSNLAWMFLTDVSSTRWSGSLDGFGIASSDEARLTDGLVFVETIHAGSHSLHKPQKWIKEIIRSEDCWDERWKSGEKCVQGERLRRCRCYFIL